MQRAITNVAALVDPTEFRLVGRVDFEEAKRLLILCGDVPDKVFEEYEVNLLSRKVVQIPTNLRRVGPDLLVEKKFRTDVARDWFRPAGAPLFGA